AYYFRHTADAHYMVVTDAAVYPDLPEGSRVVFDPAGGGRRDELRVRSWEKTQEVCAGRYTLWDEHFELPHQHLEATQTLPVNVSVGRVTHPLLGDSNTSLEIFEFPGRYAHHFDGVGPGGGDQAAEVPKIFQENRRFARL